MQRHMATSLNFIGLVHMAGSSSTCVELDWLASTRSQLLSATSSSHRPVLMACLPRRYPGPSPGLWPHAVLPVTYSGRTEPPPRVSPGRWRTASTHFRARSPLLAQRARVLLCLRRATETHNAQGRRRWEERAADALLSLCIHAVRLERRVQQRHTCLQPPKKARALGRHKTQGPAQATL